MFRLSRRNINRLAVLALLAAPIIYLFGGLFTGLIGAHGSIVYADPVEDGYDMSVEIDGHEYERWCFYGEDAYVSSVASYSIQHSWLYLYHDSISYAFLTLSEYPVDSCTNIDVGVVGNCFGLFDSDTFYAEDTGAPFYLSCCYTSLSNPNYFVSFECWYSDDLHFNVNQFYYSNGVWDFDNSFVDELFDFNSADVFPYFVFFGNDFSMHPTASVFNDSLYVLLDEYRKAPLVPQKKYAAATTSSPSLNSDYVFGQFFQHDNFLTKMGRDVSASANPPYGFAPVGMFINYVDANMLHFYPTDNGMGLFFYGYFYWCAHVLLLDFAFFGVTFIIRVLKRVMERLEGD